MWSSFIAKVRSFQPVVGTFSTLGSPAVIEVLGLSGMDFVVMDMEHGLFSHGSLHASILAAERRNIAPLVRPASHTRPFVMRPLEFGAVGVLIPMVDTPEIAEEAVAATRVPPRGVRGIGASRCCSYGTTLASHVHEADNNVLSLIQCETVESVRNLSAILSRTKPDAVFVGPTDLSQSMGHPGNAAHPEVQSCIASVLDVTRSYNVPCGILAMTAEDAEKRICQGFTVVALSTDVRVLYNSYSTLLPRRKAD